MSNTTPTPNALLAGAQWFKSEASSASGGCLEVAFLPGDLVGIRDNEDLTNPPFVVTKHVWNCWVAGAKAGEFDPPA
ncbi:DUF397 domain-containing protein [Streptomyces noursei]|uniref:ORF76 protein n=1 Tax=Streptomyces noursei TaxID=1971 RepID=Q9RHR6_STRNR|nr:DUF397 domain-containing protein [Streptomyces noursei]EOT04368.1 hypothetical protein K530_08934 [Streptomyces noursei CCRC 11814]EXU86568.1 regulatory protein [Streptomyces noursei PD-1]UWS77607.1 DUF397 domain-containing protein [Streptomyces noursei]BAA89265.1 ORF76 [Streptomyces noursei]BAD80783.1 hypothetical protein [Streptomyces noursei]